MAIIARPFEIGDVLAFPVLEVREPEGAFVIERFDPGDEIDFAVIVRMEPGDRTMATCADDQLVGLLGIRGSPNDHRLAIGPFLPDRFNEGSAAVIRSAEHTSESKSLMRISYAVICLKKKN